MSVIDDYNNSQYNAQLQGQSLRMCVPPSQPAETQSDFTALIDHFANFMASLDVRIAQAQETLDKLRAERIQIAQRINAVIRPTSNRVSDGRGHPLTAEKIAGIRAASGTLEHVGALFGVAVSTVQKYRKS